MTSPWFKIIVLNGLDRSHLVAGVIDRVRLVRPRAVLIQQAIRDKLAEHKQHNAEPEEDRPEIPNWKWSPP
ncbi:MAG: hypothetical protein AAB676_11400 [Verrucomicrobiota bacterium]